MAGVALSSSASKCRCSIKRQDGNGALRAERIVGCCEPASLAARLASVKTLTAASALGAVLVLAGCAGANSAVEPSASPPSSPAAILSGRPRRYDIRASSDGIRGNPGPVAGCPHVGPVGACAQRLPAARRWQWMVRTPGRSLRWSVAGSTATRSSWCPAR